MKVEQRIKELRTKFLQLSQIILEEIKEGKDANSSETFAVMKKIQTELEKLEEENSNNLN